MKRFRTWVAAVLAGAVLCTTGAAADDPTKLPTGAAGPVRRYQAALKVADATRADAEAEARAKLVRELKEAQKAALKRDDVDTATACATLAKEYASAEVRRGGRDSPSRARVQKSVWSQDQGPGARFKADGTFETIDRRFGGTWSDIGERRLLLTYKHAVAEVWAFDAAVETYSAVAYQRIREYKGQAQ